MKRLNADPGGRFKQGDPVHVRKTWEQGVYPATVTDIHRLQDGNVRVEIMTTHGEGVTYHWVEDYNVLGVRK